MTTIYQDLLNQSIIFLNGSIDEKVSNDVIAQLLWLDENRQKDTIKDTIKLIINSSGGIVSEGLAIYDIMQSLKTPVSTICVGHASSIATILLAAGTEGERYALPNSSIMIHQPSKASAGTESDLILSVEHLTRCRRTIELLLSYHTNQPLRKVHKDCERDFYMNAQEALGYGIIDNIITQYLLPPKPPKKT